MSLKLLAAVPTHSGAIMVECAQTLLAAQAMVLGRGGSFRIHFEAGATISLVRNAIAAEFLESDADLLLMLDSDQGVQPWTLERMIDLDQPVVGCIYPKRVFNWSQVNFESATDVNHVLQQASEFVGWLKAEESGQVSVVNGFARADHVGTGILLLKREAFHQLMSHFPELEGRGFSSDAYPWHSRSKRWGFFNPVNREDGLPLSEDISFCRRWLQTGGEIWADITSPTLHVGLHRFEGSYFDFLKATGPS